jgi:hypothetical protein
MLDASSRCDVGGMRAEEEDDNTTRYGSSDRDLQVKHRVMVPIRSPTRIRSKMVLGRRVGKWQLARGVDWWVVDAS